MTSLKTLSNSDEELLRRMIDGDEAAFVGLYRRWQSGIYRFALRMSGSEALAEDVTQEVFMILMREAGRYDSEKGTLSSYLYGIARFQVLRRMHKDRAHLSLDHEELEFVEPQLTQFFDPLFDLTREETVQSVRDAILVLPAHYREVVVLCDLQELSYAEAADILGCAIGTVRSRLHRARALLIDKLRPVADKAIAQA